MISLRPYQQEAIDAVLDYWGEGGGNPLVDLATGLGKSVVIAKLTQDLLTQYPDMRVLQLVHVKELVEQNAQALLGLWPNAPLGIYSAGLNRRETGRRITSASIQSVYKLGTDRLGKIDLVLIDEAHLCPKAGDGMYRKLIERLQCDRPDLRVCGFTATPYRLDSGRLDRGDGRLFDATVYSYGVGRGIDDGWLSPLISKRTDQQIDASNVPRQGGEFVGLALQAAVDTDEITRAAVAEMIARSADRRAWLVFCAGVKHADNVAAVLRASGIDAAAISGDTDKGMRDTLVNQFKAGRLRALCSVNVLTTGFNAPNVDMIAMLRPTLSTGLYIQMVGRGTRLAEGKINCLVLDFAGNVRRHGPVNAIVEPSERSSSKSDDEEGKVKEDGERAKECPDCMSLVAIQSRQCPDCGHTFRHEIEVKHDTQPELEIPIFISEMERLKPTENPVWSWNAARHTKFGSLDSLRINYICGMTEVSEWVMIERTGFLRRRAEQWWSQHGGRDPAPLTVTEALERFRELTPPEAIYTRPDGRFTAIVARRCAKVAA